MIPLWIVLVEPFMFKQIINHKMTVDVACMPCHPNTKKNPKRELLELYCYFNSKRHKSIFICWFTKNWYAKWNSMQYIKIYINMNLIPSFGICHSLHYYKLRLIHLAIYCTAGFLCIIPLKRLLNIVLFYFHKKLLNDSNEKTRKTMASTT